VDARVTPLLEVGGILLNQVSSSRLESSRSARVVGNECENILFSQLDHVEIHVDVRICMYRPRHPPFLSRHL